MSKKIQDFQERKISIVNDKTNMTVIDPDDGTKTAIIIPTSSYKLSKKKKGVDALTVGWKMSDLNKWLKSNIQKYYEINKEKRYQIEVLTDDGWQICGKSYKGEKGQAIFDHVNFESYLYKGEAVVNTDGMNVYAISFIQLN